MDIQLSIEHYPNLFCRKAVSENNVQVLKAVFERTQNPNTVEVCSLAARLNETQLLDSHLHGAPQVERQEKLGLKYQVKTLM